MLVVYLLPKTDVVGPLLAFRLIYFLAPLLLGLVLFGADQHRRVGDDEDRGDAEEADLGHREQHLMQAGRDVGVIESVVVYLLPKTDVVGPLLAFRLIYFLAPLLMTKTEATPRKPTSDTASST
jgi:hypothetical protein